MEVTEATIKLLVDAFYTRVRRDPVLGPIRTPVPALVPPPTWSPATASAGKPPVGIELAILSALP